jgi:hypothetical protein
MLGHATFSFTATVYGHLFEAEGEKAAAAIERALGARA